MDLKPHFYPTISLSAPCFKSHDTCSTSSFFLFFFFYPSVTLHKHSYLYADASQRDVTEIALPLGKKGANKIYKKDEGILCPHSHPGRERE